MNKAQPIIRREMRSSSEMKYQALADIFQEIYPDRVFRPSIVSDRAYGIEERHRGFWFALLQFYHEVDLYEMGWYWEPRDEYWRLVDKRR